MCDRICSIPDCEAPAYCRGWCSLHYTRWLRQQEAERGPSCSVEGCTKPVRTMGYCNAHHLRFLKYGDPEGGRGIRGTAPVPLRDRIASKIQVLPNDCWEWTGTIDRTTGYGQIGVGSKTDGTRRMRRAYRVVYETLVGPIPDGMDIDYTCHNVDAACPGGPSCPHRRCVNPEHLRPATHRANLLAGRNQVAANARKTHCPHGHEYTEANTVWDKTHRKRHCRTCANAYYRTVNARRHHSA